MAFHTVAYGESVTTAGTLQALTPVQDSTVTISGNHIYVPDKYNQVVAAAAIVAGSSAFTQAQLQAPSLREMFFPDITPLVQGVTFSGADNIMDITDNPMQLATNEGLDFYSDGGGNGSTAQNPYGLVWLSDGKLQVATGKMFTMRATSAISLVANTWVNGTITFDQTLPVGNYDVVGLRAEGTNLRAARINFIGASAVTRPGVPGCADGQTVQFRHWRYGQAGVFGTFNSITPPSVDCLGDTDSSQIFYFDLVAR